MAQPRPQVQPVAVRPKPGPVAPPVEVRVSVPSPEQFGIHLEEPAVVVPTPRELGIDLE